ncbi:hypothetical protein F5887DRAFT_671807 [Amanita rubescens]|nr:hypothetical protein F5887DRAFT_671807 [Amanita rubescens]
MLSSVVEVSIIATTTQALVTGVFFATFLVCLRWLVFSDDGRTLRKGVHWPSLIITIIFSAFAVTDFSLVLQTTLLVSEGYSGVLHIPRVINYFIEMLTPIIIDGVLIFRCWVIYDRLWRVALLPLLLMLYNISSLLEVTYLNATVHGSLIDRRDIFELGQFFASSTVINIYATFAIILKIWRNTLSPCLARFVIRVIVESGLLYTLTNIATFCAMIFSPDSVLWITHAISFPTSLIAYNLILIRVAQNRATPKPELPTFISESTIERAIPSEKVAS